MGRIEGKAGPRPDFLSPRRTGREDFPHPTLAETTSRKHAQAVGRPSGSEKLQAEALKVRIIRDSLRRTEGPLAASPQILAKTNLHVFIDLIESMTGITRREFGLNFARGRCFLHRDSSDGISTVGSAQIVILSRVRMGRLAERGL